MAVLFDMSKQRRVTRRTVLRGGSLSMGALASAFVLSCGGDKKDDKGGTSGEKAPAASQAKKGGVLRMGLTTDVTVTEPHRIGLMQGTILWPLFEPVITLDQQFKPQGVLAEKWEQTPDNLQLTLKLRQGVTFHSGRNFSAEDVKWNIARVQDPAAPFAQFRAIASKFTSVQTPDPNTVIIKMAQPLSVVWDFFDQFMTADKDTVADPVKMVGTGPWKLGEFKQGSTFRIDRNEKYWGDKVNLDSINWSIAIGDAEAMNTQFESGGLDAMYQPSVLGFARFKANPQYQTMLHGATGAYFINGFNMTKQPFADKRVRQAFNWATDRKRFVDLVLKGVYPAASLPWPNNSVAYEDSKNKFYNTVDLKKAADLLRAAGVTTLKTNCLSTTSQEVIDFMQIWQSDLKTIGVTLEPTPLQGAAFIDSNDNLKYDAVYAASAGGAGLSQPVSLFVTATNIFSGDGNNNVGFNNARWRELTDLLVGETDVNKQKKLYSEVNDIMLDEVNQAFTAPLAPRLVMNKKVKGITWRAHDAFVFENASIE